VIVFKEVYEKKPGGGDDERWRWERWTGRLGVWQDGRLLKVISVWRTR
jgi:hypothetical protein